MHLPTTAGAGRRTRRALLATVPAAGALAGGAVAHPRAAPTCFGESGFDIVGTSQDDTLVGTRPDRIYGGRGADRVYGLGGDDPLCGGAGPDLIDGAGGIDRIDGADDALRAKAGRTAHGNDHLSGGPTTTT